ncbi:hypothetical protein SNE40_001377 [Patella caerulea]|uniref:Uncharacterized protein n=1 Tax=Patella caerulea TaxID=87958 RepID=A0AAN8KMW8_PATCE
MAFSLTFHNILDKNIRNIYSGNQAQTTYRQSTEFHRPPVYDDRPDKKLLVQSSDYIQEYRCFIPKAQAFRSLPLPEVDEIVTRLRKPTLASTGEGKSSEDQVIEEKALTTPRYLGLKTVSKAEEDLIVQNLNRPTQMSTIRERSKSKMPEVYN